MSPIVPRLAERIVIGLSAHDWRCKKILSEIVADAVAVEVHHHPRPAVELQALPPL